MTWHPVDIGGKPLADLPRGIIIVATPLGNVADATPRLAQALAQADYIAAEDTRRTRSLAQSLGVDIRGRVMSNFDHNEQARVAQLLGFARSGTVVIVTDAGMPIVSDPGFPLVAAAHDEGIPVTCFPGPSAVLTALALSGLHVGKFAFDGFAPRKTRQRRTWLEGLKKETRAVCFFESPHRIAATLADAVEILGEQRRVAVARELTKTYEEVKRGCLGEIAQWAEQGIRGEITVVLEGVQEVITEHDKDALVAQVLAYCDEGMRLKEACALVAQRSGASKKELYNAVLESRDGA
ncbi:16S rRNA (cytidine(1402)-2'-O)-methyltransferase [Corynebacterium sp. sy039]|uniref:16S rRNA (cytidine(1402)-2'-O)-methyltransferase n=1 Tax=Corynebacterium sp. sy039 TaxID=2599641 RepID=UPI0011B72B74|nr:16S rRNA (cytidine(1402)-2'-O)-methyltransferase [Corynebacterium sp. sy039]QDZ42255.1 16S rRNA (cytidine(1402)-2'-O)-methyltransferase [Corynebacterium sp. sy039]